MFIGKRGQCLKETSGFKSPSAKQWVMWFWAIIQSSLFLDLPYVEYEQYKWTQ